MSVDTLDRNAALRVIELFAREFQCVAYVVLCDVKPFPVAEKGTDAKVSVGAMLPDVQNSARERFNWAVVSLPIDMMVDANSFPSVLLVCQPQSRAVR